MPSGSDELTRITAFISAGIASLSLVVSYLAYRRGGTKIRVNLDVKDIRAFPPEAGFRLTIVNRGMNSVQIVYWRIYEGASPGARYAALNKPAVVLGRGPLLTNSGQKGGQELPCKLEGQHSLSWDIETDHLASRMYFTIRFRTAVYAEVGLGSGKTVHGKSSYLMRQRLRAYKKEKGSGVRLRRLYRPRRTRRPG